MDMLTIMDKLCDDCRKELCEAGDNEGITSLFSFLKTLKKLLKVGVDVNKVKALESAAQCGHEECVDALIEAGADVNAKTCPLALAIKSGNRRCVELLVKAGADVNYGETDWLNQTPIFIAVRSGFNEGLDLLIKVGADVNRRDNDLSPLMLAAAFGFYKCVEVLLAAGVDVNEVNNTGETALVCISLWYRDYKFKSEIQRQVPQEVLPKINFIECIKILLRAGAKVNLKLWKNRFLEYFIQDFNMKRESFLLLYAAGETLEGNTVSVDDPENKNLKIPDHLMLDDLDRLDLMHMCRLVIRKHLLKVDPHEHLFARIPRLGLPQSLSKYLLYNFSLE